LGLLSDIGDGPLGLDSSIFIYYIEEDPQYIATLDPVFDALTEGRLKAATSALTLLETLVVPLRIGNEVLARQYQRFLMRSAGLLLVPLDFGVLRAAAYVRATARLKTPDALQVASALSAGCDTFLTNDGRITTPLGLRILQLEDYVET
jgi:predicted nucleic acid-binding protein